MNNSPLVSIVIPVYNGSKFLGQAIDSALNQTYKNIEVVVINDGSNDNGKTQKVAESYGSQVRYFEKENGGVASALNYAIEVMEGEYFSWLSHDDLYHPDKVQAQLNTIKRHKEANIVPYSDFDIIDEWGVKLSTIQLSDSNAKFFRFWLTVENSLHGCSLLVPKECFAECGNFNETLLTSQDYDLWFRIAEKYKFVHVSEVLVSGRRHGSQTSRRLSKRMIIESNVLRRKFLFRLSEEEFPLYNAQTLSKIGDSFTKRRLHLAAYAAYSRAVSLPGSPSLLMFVYIKILRAKLRIALFQRYLKNYFFHGGDDILA